MSKSLTLQDYCRAAKELNCEVGAIRAVAKVESNGAGFLPDGRVVILFERHHFARLTKNVFSQSHPQISSRSAGGYFGNEKEYQRFNAAYSLNPTAAMMSCSWGRFQIMGFNYGVCGFSSIHSFVDAMKESEGEQLKAFCGFVETNNLGDELRSKDWSGFARGYNGKNYKINRYDEKLLSAYNRFKVEKIDCGQFRANPVADISDHEINNLLETIPADLPDQSPQIISQEIPPIESQTVSAEPPPEQLPIPEPTGDAPETKPKSWLHVEDVKPFVLKWLKRIWGGLTTFNAAQFATLTGSGFSLGGRYWWVWLIAGLVILFFTFAAGLIVSLIFLGIWFVNRREINRAKELEAKLKADPNQNNIGLKIEAKL